MTTRSTPSQVLVPFHMMSEHDQYREPMNDELLGIEIHDTPRTAHSVPDIVQHAACLRVGAKEVRPPSVWSTALDPVEECAIALLQRR